MTNIINEDDKGDCDYQDDLDDWGGWDDKDHRHCTGDFGDQDDQGGWDKVNDSLTGIHRKIGMSGIPVVSRMARVTMMNLR